MVPPMTTATGPSPRDQLQPPCKELSPVVPAQACLDLGPEIEDRAHTASAEAVVKANRTRTAPPPGRFGHSEAMLAVLAFHTAFNLPRRSLPDVTISDELARLR